MHNNVFMSTIINTFMHMYIYIYVYIHIHAHAYIHTCMYVYTCIDAVSQNMNFDQAIYALYIQMYRYNDYKHIHSLICLYIYIYIYIHMCIKSHT
jgi:hypothetical protein